MCDLYERATSLLREVARYFIISWSGRLFVLAHTFQEAICQPLAHRLIVEFQRSVSQYEGTDESKYHIRNAFSHCRIIVAYPSGISINQRIMGDVHRIGNISQELADAYRTLTAYFAAGAHRNNNREDEDDTKSIIQSVHP